jgi:hypothetical protein
MRKMQGNGAYEQPPRHQAGTGHEVGPKPGNPHRPSEAGAVELARAVVGSSSPAEADSDGPPEAGASDAAQGAGTTEVAALEAVQFDAYRNGTYHAARTDHYVRSHRWLMFAIVAAGTAGVTNLFEAFIGQGYFGAATAILAALDLALDYKARASQHERLKHAYFNLFATITTAASPDAAKVRRWRGQIIRLTADEPKTYRGVDAIAYNNAADALGRDRELLLAIPRHVRLLAPIWPFSGYAFDYVREKKRKKRRSALVRIVYAVRRAYRPSRDRITRT